MRNYGGLQNEIVEHLGSATTQLCKKKGGTVTQFLGNSEECRSPRPAVPESHHLKRIKKALGCNFANSLSNTPLIHKSFAAVAGKRYRVTRRAGLIRGGILALKLPARKNSSRSTSRSPTEQTSSNNNLKRIKYPPLFLIFHKCGTCLSEFGLIRNDL